MARSRPTTRAPGPQTGWTQLPFEVRLGANIPEPGIGGVIPRAAIPVDPAIPAAYEYEIAVQGTDALGRPLGRSYFTVRSQAQILGAELRRLIDDLTLIPVVDQRALYDRGRHRELPFAPATLEVTIYRVTRQS